MAKARESAAFKLVVVLAAAGAVYGLVVARRHLTGETPPPTSAAQAASSASASATASAPVPSSSASSSASAAADAASPPTAADRTALREAAVAGDLAKVQELAGKGVALTDTLGPAAASGNLALVTWLLDHGVSPHEDEEAAVSPLLVADPHESVVAFLLAHGTKEATLLAAARAGAPNAVTRILAKTKTEANAKTAEGEPALHVAIANTAGTKRQAIVEALLRAGADANAKHDRMTALGLAVSAYRNKTEGALDIVKLLLAKGAVVDIETLAGSAASTDKADADALKDVFLANKIAPDAAYMMIMNERDPKLIARIGAKGVAWTSEHPMLPPTPPLVSAARDVDVARVSALLAAGAPVDRAGEGDETALFAVIDAATPDSENATAIATALLAKGANANKRTAGGQRPLHSAATKGEEGIVKALLAKGAHVDDEVNGTTALEAAEAHGHQGVAKLLLAKGAKKKKSAPD
jgi:ankyrin repeat protein